MEMNKKGRRTGITMNKKLGSTLIAMTIIIFMLFLTLGMFTKNFGGSASAEIATPRTSIIGDNISDGYSVDEGGTGEYVFSVRNTDKNDTTKVSEVSMKYTLTVDTVQLDSSNVSVSYDLYRITIDNSGNEVETKLINWDATKGFTDSNLPTLQHGSIEAHKYKLKFTPNNEGKFKFNVKVKSEQID